MKLLLQIIFCLLLAQITTAQSFKKLHRKATVVDAHNDILTKAVEMGLVLDNDLSGKTHTDLNRWIKGGLDVQLFSVWSDGERVNPYAYAMRQIDTVDALVKRNSGKMVKTADTKEIRSAVKQYKIAALIGLEGGHQIENDLSKLDSFFNRGVRYMTLTWNNSTNWATSALDETTKKDLTHKGLTDFGIQVVQRMNHLGMMVDVSHVGEQTFWDAIKGSNKPVIASHSSVYHICPHRRNLKDDQIKAIAKSGGVVQINFYPGFIDSTAERKFQGFLKLHKAENDSLMKSGLSEWVAGELLFSKYKSEVQQMRPPLSLVIQHIEYVINLVGIDFVGLGSDFDGIEFTPMELDDVTSYPNITKALLDKGYSKKHIKKIMGGNLLRVVKANERVHHKLS